MDELLALIGRSVAESHEALAQFDLIATVEEDLEEGEVPRRWLQSLTDGFDVEHNSKGIISTIFIYVVGDVEHQPFSGTLTHGLSKTSVQRDVRAILGAPSWSRPPASIPGLGNYGPADRYDSAERSVHFQYSQDDGRIELITAMTHDAVPQTIGHD